MFSFESKDDKCEVELAQHNCDGNTVNDYLTAEIRTVCTRRGRASRLRLNDER